MSNKLILILFLLGFLTNNIVKAQFGFGFGGRRGGFYVGLGAPYGWGYYPRYYGYGYAPYGYYNYPVRYGYSFGYPTRYYRTYPSYFYY